VEQAKTLWIFKLAELELVLGPNTDWGSSSRGKTVSGTVALVAKGVALPSAYIRMIRSDGSKQFRNVCLDPAASDGGAPQT
jgi:hypothetical protein